MAGLIGYFVPAIAGGLIVALPTVFITIYGSNLARAIAIPLLGVAGLALPGLITFLACRWYLHFERRSRMKVPLHHLNRSIEFIVGAFPDVVESWGGRDALLEPQSAERISSQLERSL